MKRGLLLLLVSGACAASAGSATRGSSAPSCEKSPIVANPPALTPERVPSTSRRPRPRETLRAAAESLERLLAAIDPLYPDYTELLERTAAAYFELHVAESAADATRARDALARAAAHLARVDPGSATQDAASLHIRGLVLEQTGSLAAARDAYRAALRLGGSPGDMARLHYALGLHALLERDEQRALLELERASELVRRAPDERPLQRAIDELAAASRPRRPCDATASRRIDPGADP